MLITQPGDPITDFVGSIGQGCPYPSGLGAADILDWSLAPYLNYGANPPGSAFAGPVGYVVTPGIGSSIITAARIYTSINATADDPADFTLYGSNDGVIWWLIDYTTLALPYARNASVGTINAKNQVLQEIDFPNTNSYAMYAVYFTNIVNNSAVNGLQFAEVQLLGVPLVYPLVPLTAQVSSTNIVLTWAPAPGFALIAIGYNLQSNTNLANTNGWVNVTNNAVSLGNGQYQVTVPLSLSAGAVFFRTQLQ